MVRLPSVFALLLWMATAQSTCPDGQVKLNGTCLPYVVPGKTCEATAQCVDYSTCANSCTCTDPEEFYHRGYCVKGGYNDRLLKAIPGEACSDQEQCLGGSNCVSQKCACPSGTTEIQGHCVNSSSSSNCPLNQVNVNGTCISLAAPGSACQATAQCIGSSTCAKACTCTKPGSKIWMAYCEPPELGCGFRMTKVDGQCVKNAFTGYTSTPCDVDMQCRGGGSCNKGTCSCPRNNMWTTDNSMHLVFNFCPLNAPEPMECHDRFDLCSTLAPICHSHHNASIVNLKAIVKSTNATEEQIREILSLIGGDELSTSSEEDKEEMHEVVRGLAGFGSDEEEDCGCRDDRCVNRCQKRKRSSCKTCQIFKKKVHDLVSMVCPVTCDSCGTVDKVPSLIKELVRFYTHDCR